MVGAARGTAQQFSKRGGSSPKRWVPTGLSLTAFRFPFRVRECGLPDLSPDRHVLDGTFAKLLAVMAERPEVGVIGVRQLTADGHVHPTIRRFPSIARRFRRSWASDSAPISRWRASANSTCRCTNVKPSATGVSGTFMLSRREALTLESAGVFDERFFLFSEEVDLRLRIKFAGWHVVHLLESHRPRHWRYASRLLQITPPRMVISKRSESGSVRLDLCPLRSQRPWIMAMVESSRSRLPPTGRSRVRSLSRPAATAAAP